MNDFKKNLNTLISTAFDNEQAFIKRFLPNGITDVSEIYMAASGTKIMMLDSNMNQYTTVISTDDFIDWVNSIKDGE